ncbi:MAG TPA: DUF3147 domain-containing protein [Dehalococcoidia bacterium]|nr:DUF3147 domain-containing protein [Dehalococcoidia bacterium]
MDIRLLAVYFILGGTIVALVTYFGSQGKGLLAAFVAFFPSITIVTLLSVYLSSGVNATVSYFKGMLLLIPAWLLYAVAIVLFLPRWGLVPSLLVGIGIYVAAALITMRLVH